MLVNSVFFKIHTYMLPARKLITRQMIDGLKEIAKPANSWIKKLTTNLSKASGKKSNLNKGRYEAIAPPQFY